MNSIPDLGNIPIEWERVISCLKAFKTKIEDPDNVVYNDQLKDLGIDLMMAFFTLGQSLNANGKTAKQVSMYLDVKPITEAVEEHIELIGDFILMYGINEIDFEGSNTTRNICGIRSGVQFLLDYFTDFTDSFQLVLEKLEEDINEFDRMLHVWIDNGHRYSIPLQYLPSNIPQEHWWWF